MKDASQIAELCKESKSIPYMVIDDGWQKNSCDAPWDKTNERFPDMKRLAGEMKAVGTHPGIWLRYLSSINDTGAFASSRLERDRQYLDPSRPEVIEYIQETTYRLRDWGYELIKHDYSTCDLFGNWGLACPEALTYDGWSSFDNSPTSAEIVLDMYRKILDASADTAIIGCNTISHLSTGLVHVNRTGDDTSGIYWERTRQRGVNTLAFRGIQNNIFYQCDADCAGITKAIDYAQNDEWVRALEYSGTPGVLSDDEFKILAGRLSSEPAEDKFIPLNWMENICPDRWLYKGNEVNFNWYKNGGIESFNP